MTFHGHIPTGKGLIPVELVVKIHSLLDTISSPSNLTNRSFRPIPAKFTTFDNRKINIDLNICRPSITSYKKPILKRSELENIEDLIVVWLDQNTNQTVENVSKRETHLRQIINCLKTFDDPDQCVRYVQDIKEEKIILIMSGSLGKMVINELHNHPQILSIYIYCFDKHEHDHWTKNYSKIIDIVTTEHELITRITNDVTCFFQNNISVEVINSVDVSEKSIQDLTKDQARFMWSQILIDILLRLPQTSQSKNELIQECRRYYKNNKYQQTKITEFEQTYTATTALSWYTRNTFLYRIVNKALRTQNLLYIFKCRFFIIDLYQQLIKLHQKFLKTTKKKLITVYRGQLMAADEFSKLKNNIDGFVSINTFFSTSHSSAAALEFAGNGSGRPMFESVYFEIELDLDISEARFGDINRISQFESENELLICIGTVFRIEIVEPLTDSLSYIKLVLASGNETAKLNHLKQWVMAEIQRTSPYLALGIILQDMGEYNKAQTYYELLLAELPSNHIDVPAIYSGLGSALMSMQKNSKLALKYLRESLILQRKSFPDNILLFAQTLNSIASVHVEREKFKLGLVMFQFILEILDGIHVQPNVLQILTRKAAICNNIGYIYSKTGQLSLSLKYYKMSLTIARKTLPPNHPDIALSLNNIGMIYSKKLDSQTAEKYLQEANIIRQESLPFECHPDLAQMYNNLGIIQYHQRHFDAALAHFEKALEIQLKCLPPVHPHTAMLYNSIGNAYLEKKVYTKALEMYKNSLKIGQQCWSPIHSEISEAYGNIGLTYCYLGDYKQALCNCEKALEISLQCLSSTHPDLAEAYRSIGKIHSATGNHRMAIANFQKTLDIYVAKPPLDQEYLGMLYEELGNEYYDEDHYQDAIRCFQKALEIFRSCQREDVLLAVLYYHLGKAYYHHNEYENALVHLSKCLDYEVSVTSKANLLSLSQTYHAIGETFQKLNDYQMALKNYTKALETLQKDNSSSKDADTSVLIEKCQKNIEIVKTLL